MKILTLFFLLNLCLSTAFGQDTEFDFTKIDEHARSVSESKATSVKSLAKSLIARYKTGTEKVRAIYVWVTHNVKYDMRLLSENSGLTIEQKKRKQQPERILKSKRAVCEGYTNLFVALCEEAGLPCHFVTGYTKNVDGQINPTTHAWNVVKVDGAWHLVDATWGAGGFEEGKRKYVKNMDEAFFLAKPEDFIQDHFPVDPLFQMLEVPVSLEEFSKNEDVASVAFVKQKTGEIAFASVADSLDHFAARDSVGRLTSTCLRTLRFDPKNGYAIYVLSGHYYYLARDEFNAFGTESQAVTKNPKTMTQAHIHKWEQQIAFAKSNCQLALTYLNRVEKKDPLYATCQDSKKNVEQALKSTAEVEKLLPQWRGYVQRKE
jgi:hypothetical protein